MAGDLQTLKEKGVFRRSWKFRELQVRDPKKSRNLITVLCCFADGLILAFCAVSALLRALTEEETIAHACVSKSRYHEVKKHLLEIIVLPPKNGIGGNPVCQIEKTLCR